MRVIVFKEGDNWVGQCLEHDIGAQAPSLKELEIRLALTIEAECEESLSRTGKEFGGIAPAPQLFHEMWEGRTGDYKPVHKNEHLRRHSTLTLDMALCA